MGITEERIKRITEQAAAMKAIGKASVDVSSELEFIVCDNAAMEAEIRGLEEANARLRERLNRGENHDAYMKLPLDADGVPIRVGDEMDIDGEIAVVRGYQVSYKGDELQFIAVTEGYRKTFTLFGKNRKHFKHDTMPSDSWEKLEEDAMRSACELSGSGHLRCGDCEWGKEDIGCQAMARLEILKRAKKLAGIEELEGGER